MKFVNPLFRTTNTSLYLRTLVICCDMCSLLMVVIIISTKPQDKREPGTVGTNRISPIIMYSKTVRKRKQKLLLKPQKFFK